MHLIDELLASLVIPSQENDKVFKPTERWKPPDFGWVKINSDGAISSAQRCAGAGVVVRDHVGNLLAGRCMRFDAIQEPLVIEQLACREAVRIAVEHGFQQVIVETDSQEVLKLWNDEKNSSIGANVIKEMKTDLLNLQGFILQAVRRSANNAAHVCARAALNLVPDVFSFTVTPEFLIDSIQSELYPLKVE